jgi:glycine/sarcosine N-methyltransferase
MTEAEPMFDAFQPFYDLMVSWESRMALEGPFFQRVFAKASVRRVLDCACGTGHHVRLFSRWGLDATGTDASPAMIEQARRDAHNEAVHAVNFQVADFRELPPLFRNPFDAVICIGNSLPLAGSPDALRQAVKSMADVLAPNGLIVFQMLNYGLIPEGANVYEDPRVRRLDDREILFMKVFRRTRRLCDMDIVVLEKQAAEWKKIEAHARAWAVEQPELEAMVMAAGFSQLQVYGGYEPKPFDPAASRDLILVARKEKAGK